MDDAESVCYQEITLLSSLLSIESNSIPHRRCLRGVTGQGIRTVKFHYPARIFACFLLLQGTPLFLESPALGANPELVVQTGNKDEVTAIAWAAHAPVLASASEDDGVIKIWDTRTWELVRTIRAASETYFDTVGSVINCRGLYPFRTLSLSPDGRVMAYSVSDANLKGHQLKLIDPRSGALLQLFTGPGLVDGIVFSPDSKVIAAIVWPQQVNLWSVGTGELLGKIGMGHSQSMAFSPDGRLLAIDSQVWDLRTGKLIRTFGDETATFGPVAFSPDGSLVATAGETPDWQPPNYAATESAFARVQVVKIWNLHTGKRIYRVEGHNYGAGHNGAQSLQFTPDGHYLMSVGEDRTDLWDVSSGKRWRSFWRSRAHEVGRCSALSPDGTHLANASTDEIDIWDPANTPSGRIIRSLRASGPPVSSFVFSPDGSRLFSVTSSPQNPVLAWEWSVRTGRLLRALSPGSGYRGSAYPGEWTNLSPVFLPGGAILCKQRGSFATLQPLGAPPAQKLRLPRAVSNTIAQGGDGLLAPDGNTFVSWSYNGGSLSVWDIGTWRLKKTIDGLRGPGWGTFSPDGKRIAFSGEGLIAQVVEIANGQVTAIQGNGIQPEVFLQDSRGIATVSQDRSTVTIWDTETGEQIQPITAGNPLQWDGNNYRGSTLVPGPGPLLTYSFSPNGRVLATANLNALSLRDSHTGAVIKTLDRPAAAISAVAFSPGGRQLAVGSTEGSTQLWDVATGRLLITWIGFATMRGKVAHADWIAYTPVRRYDGSPGAERFIRWRLNRHLFPASKHFHRRLDLTLAGTRGLQKTHAQR